MRDELGWCIFFLVLFVVTILAEIVYGLTYNHKHCEDPCEYCYFEKAYDAYGNEKLIWKGCER